jgi:type IV secretion system protein TrbG
VRSILKMVVIAVLMALIVLAHKKATAAQNQDTPVQVKRIPPPQADASPDPNEGQDIETPNQRRRRLAAEAAPAPPLLEEYPFTEALGALQGGAPKAPTKRLPHPPTPKSSVKKAEAPRDSRPKESVSPSVTASEAVTMSDRWQKTGDMPAEGTDGRVVFSDGGGLPTVVCAPLRLCIVELQTGEKLTGEPQVGDSVRWRIEPASYGSGELTTPIIVIKPTAVGLDTNLVITTDRRSYYLRLMSNSQDYVARVSFDYPDDARAKWSIALQKQAQAAKEMQFDKGVKTLADSV